MYINDRRKRQRSTSPPRIDSYVPSYDRDGYLPGPRTNISDRDAYSGQLYLNPNQFSGFPDPNKLDFQVSFKHYAEFCRRTHNVYEEEEIQRRYAAYKDKYQQKILTQFFNENQNEEWFKEKYHPTLLVTRREEINVRKQDLNTLFLSELDDGKFDLVDYDDLDPYLDAPPISANDDEIFEFEIKEQLISNLLGHKNSIMRLVTEYPATHLLFIKAVPLNYKRQQVVKALIDVPGFKRLELSDPNSSRKHIRLGWALFDSEDGVNDVLKKCDHVKIDDIEIPLVRPIKMDSKIKTLPADTKKDDRLKKDLSQIRKLSASLDEEVGLSGSEIIIGRVDKIADTFKKLSEDTADEEVELVEVRKIKKTLDLFITYLRRVHLFDYYTGYESDSPELFNRRSGISFRSAERLLSLSPEKFFDRMDGRIDLRIRRPRDGPEIERIGGKNIDKEIDELIHKFTGSVAESKFRCELCTKLFKGADFVAKHMQKKHPEKIEDLTQEILMFNSYVRDPHRPSNPVNQPGSVASGNGSMISPMASSSNGRGRRMSNEGYQQQHYRGGDRHTPRGRGDFRRGGSSSTGSVRSRPPADTRPDPRQIRSYVDLDAPVDGEAEINYD